MAASKKNTRKKSSKSIGIPALILLLAVLLFLGNIHMCGALGNVFRAVGLGLFGTFGNVLPLALVLGDIVYWSFDEADKSPAGRLAAVGIAYVCVCAFVQIFSSTVMDPANVLSYWTYCSQGGFGGGLAGGALCLLLKNLLGGIGCGLVLAAVIIVCAVVISGGALLELVTGYGEELLDTKKKHEDIRKEDRAARKQLRMKNRSLDMEEKRIQLEEERTEEEQRALEREMRISERKKQLEEKKFSGVDIAGSDIKKTLLDEEKEANAAAADKASLAADEEDQKVINGDFGKYEEVPFDEDKAFDAGESASELVKESTANFFGGGSRIFSFDKKVIKEKNDRIRSIPISGGTDADEIWAENPAETGAESAAEAVSEGPDDHMIITDEHDGDFIQADSTAFPAGPSIREISVENEDTGAGEDSIYIQAEPDDVFDAGIFATAEGEKHIVTASGKVIDTDTSAVARRTVREEERRRQDTVAYDTDVAAAIKTKEDFVPAEYSFPPEDLLEQPKPKARRNDSEYRETARKLEETLKTFGVRVSVTNISCGPSVTRYELHPEQGVKVSRIVALQDDIKLSLAAADIRIEAPIPGKSAVGIEVPNKENNTVSFRELMNSDSYKNHKSKLAFAVGKDISGQVVVADIAKMPHLLIAGATGSGKSVCINTLIMSILYHARPDEVKMLLIDPKVVELSVYNGIPHLLIPVVTDPKKASAALNWAVAEMTDRYKKFAKMNVRDLKGYNAKIEQSGFAGTDEVPQKMYQIVIIIDELADLMMVASGEVEDAICRLAQLARACGIHLVIATQRPSVNVITGLIKANVPSRIAFAVSSGVDSRTIIDMIGAEKLLGKGDMLFYPAGYPKPQRVQGAYVSDQEVMNVVEFLSRDAVKPADAAELEKHITDVSEVSQQKPKDDRDEYFADAGRFIIEKDKASIGLLQRFLKIGFNRAARIMDQLASAGVVSEEDGTKPRKILMTGEEFEQVLSGNRD